MLHRDTTVLVVIDFQERLMPKIPVAEPVLGNAVKLIRFARELALPILLTEQYPKGLGRTVPEIAAELEGVVPIEKTAFGCMGDSAFVEALEATGCKQLLMTGVETHVCVMQTSLAALDAGYEVFIPRDAVGSREKYNYKAGLARMDRAGAQLVTTEMAMFELLREAGTPTFRRVLPLIR